jgi:hypothetical protein
METTFRGGPRAILSRSATGMVTASTAWATAAWLILLWVSDAHSQEALRWKLTTGEVLRYKTEQQTRLSVKVQGREPKQRRDQTVYYNWKVVSVSNEGVAQISQKIDRLVMRVEAPPFMPFEWDSSNPKADVPEPFEPEVKQLKATVGAEFSFQVKPSGQIDDIKIPEQTLKSLRDALPPEAASQGQFSEQMLKDLVMQSSPPPFPEAAVEPGKSWSSKPSKLATPQWTLVTDKVFTFQGADPKSPELALIDMQTRVSLEPSENAKIKIRSQEGKGSLTFDVKAGRVVNSRSSQKLEMAIADMGQNIEQTTETTSTMTLMP